MADGHKQLAADLIDALQNETLDGFIGFIYEGGERNKERAEKLKKDDKRLQQLIEMLQTVKTKLGKINTNIFIFIFKLLLKLILKNRI